MKNTKKKVEDWREEFDGEFDLNTVRTDSGSIKTLNDIHGDVKAFISKVEANAELRGAKKIEETVRGVKYIGSEQALDVVLRILEAIKTTLGDSEK